MVWSLDPVKSRAGVSVDTSRQLILFVCPVNTATHVLLWTHSNQAHSSSIRIDLFPRWHFSNFIGRRTWRKEDVSSRLLPDCRPVQFYLLSMCTAGPDALGGHKRGLGGSQKLPWRVPHTQSNLYILSEQNFFFMKCFFSYSLLFEQWGLTSLITGAQRPTKIHVRLNFKKRFSRWSKEKKISFRGFIFDFQPSLPPYAGSLPFRLNARRDHELWKRLPWRKRTGVLTLWIVNRDYLCFDSGDWWVIVPDILIFVL